MKEIEKNNITDRKKIYKLWWEYLKRSEGYKAFIEKHPEVLKNNDLLRFYSFDGYKLYDEIGEDNDEDPEYREYVKERDKWRRALSFGNVHKDSFESWWKKFTQLPEEEPVEELSKHIDRMMKKTHTSTASKSLNVYKNFNLNMNLGSKCKEYLKFDFVSKSAEIQSKALHELIEQPDQPFIYLIINADTFTDDNIAEIKNIARRRKEGFIKRRADKILYFHKPYFKEIGRIRYDELQRYLKIYDLKKTGMKWKNVFNEVYPRRVWNELARRSILAEYSKAKHIIKNTEIGDFPGKSSG